MEKTNLAEIFRTLAAMYGTKGLAPDIAPLFQNTVYKIAAQHPRLLPWRISPSPYSVFVSELMLQQTQAIRVAEKFAQFIDAFPDFINLAKADFSNVLRHWVGLGYNRRALFLHKSAQIIASNYRGILPADPTQLRQLPGIGPATAHAICAFAFNMPVVYLETNIRAVYIHAFFPDNHIVDDKDLLPLAHHCLDRKNPSRWYNALMDAGVVIKQLHRNPARKSRGYRRQGKFSGSWRQLRGRILNLITAKGTVREDELLHQFKEQPDTIQHCLVELSLEGFLVKDINGNYTIANS